MRFFFVLAPAALMGEIGWLVHPVIGVIFAACVIYGGLFLTEPHPERGERR